MLFSEPLVIRKIETFRNEFVHNGPWDLRCSIYNTFVNEEPADVIIYSPDMDDLVILFAQGLEINSIHKEIELIFNYLIL